MSDMDGKDEAVMDDEELAAESVCACGHILAGHHRRDGKLPHEFTTADLGAIGGCAAMWRPRPRTTRYTGRGPDGVFDPCGCEEFQLATLAATSSS